VSHLPAGKFEALLERGTLLFGQMRLRAPGLSSGTTWSKASKIFQLWCSAAGKTESQADVWLDGKTVSQLFRKSGKTERDYGDESPYSLGEEIG
jgi:hypothetical protein